MASVLKLAAAIFVVAALAQDGHDRTCDTTGTQEGCTPVTTENMIQMKVGNHLSKKSAKKVRRADPGVAMVFDGCLKPVAKMDAESSVSQVLAANTTVLGVIPEGARYAEIATRCCKTSPRDGKLSCRSREPRGSCFSKGVDFSTARAECQRIPGWDLCTKEELTSDVCCRKGCKYDHHFVWTSDVDPQDIDLTDEYAAFVDLYNSGEYDRMESEHYTAPALIVPPTCDSFMGDISGFFNYMANDVGVADVTLAPTYTQMTNDGNTIHEIGMVDSNSPVAQGPYYTRWERDADGNFLKNFCILAIAGCVNVTSGTSGDATDLATIQARNDQFSEYFNANDMEGVASLFTNDAFVVPPTRNAYVPRAGVAGFFTSFHDAGIRNVNLRAVHVLKVGDVIHEIGEVTSSPGPVGPYYVRWELEEGEWRLAFDITSIAPAP